MSPSELELLILDMRSELLGEADTAEHRARLGRYHGLLLGFARHWRQLYQLHGEDPARILKACLALTAGDPG